MLGLLLSFLFVGNQARAGVVELGVSANYRSSSYDHNNYVQSLSYTGALTYYFAEMFAAEANYTTGYAKEVAKGTLDSDPKQKIEDNIDMVSLDLVVSLAARDAPFRPYVKLGAGYLMKDRYLQVNDDDKNLISHERGLVPSGGLGLSIALTKTFNFKVGLEAWTSPPKYGHMQFDYAGRAGIGLLF